MDEKHRRYLDIIDEALGDIFAESDQFEKSVYANLDQVSPENGLILNGIVMIKNELEAVMNLFRELMEEQYERTDAILDSLDLMEKRLEQDGESGSVLDED